MTNEQNTNQEFIEMFERFKNPEMQSIYGVVNSIAGFDLSASDKQSFLYFHNYLTNPQPEFINNWRADPKQEKWYLKFANGVLGDVQGSLACVLYHHGRLKNIESTIIESIEKYNYREVLGNGCMALGNTRIWDFEYQAFILAYRRCLDYLAKSLTAYFKNDFHSFRTLNDFLEKHSSNEVATSLIPIHAKYCPLFKFVLSEGNRKSVRDKISHYEYVPAGCINLSSRGFMFVGGGENLGFDPNSNAFNLSDILDNHVVNLKNCIREMIYQYVDSIRKVQK